ncbi:helix-turn-helix domain-containing protein [Sphingomonas sp. CFBP 8765]|uniref:helix-turn-helix domain-containing protein n=1 Tax=Sphingomonas sp. CFBP 8765 TaxID=2775274 RepID=UPI0017808443|nr:XRE family transcriptional regulator [Sphingomonas sp. CFBP 8765]MBD8469190.1 XRE family transcriptional regulator [Sphingomonas sp. CFBP 8765]
MEASFNSQRLRLARSRREMTSQALADAAGISPVTLSRIENKNNQPEPETIEALANALRYPKAFLFGDDLDEVDRDDASFRSLKAMTAKERKRALAAASLAFLVSDKIDEKFGLPEMDVPNLSHERTPESAAETLRAHWGLGDRPVGNMIDLLEAKGVRVYSLAEETVRVDAFSCWRSGIPFIFLNTLKSSEHSRFDAAHELGHLCMHQHGGSGHKSAEPEANAFAASFLMPASAVRSRIGRVRSLGDIQNHKKRWGVSLAALTYHLSKIGVLSEWQARGYFIQMNRDGTRTKEPDPMPFETSHIWRTVFQELWNEKITKAEIARDINIPEDEFETLVFGLAGKRDEREVSIKNSRSKGLSLIVDNERVA